MVFKFTELFSQSKKKRKRKSPKRSKSKSSRRTRKFSARKVSKAFRAQGSALREARANLGITGFVPVGGKSAKGKQLKAEIDKIKKRKGL